MTDALETDPVSELRTGQGTVEVWQGSDRLWRYRFLHPGGTVIRSNRSFLTRDQAMDSAALAYPGVPVLERSKSPVVGPSSHSWRKLAVVTMVTGAIGLILIAVAKVLLFIRRSVGRGQQLAKLIGTAADLSRRNR